MIKAIYIIVILTQQWNGNWISNEIPRISFPDHVACQEYVDRLQPKVQPAPQTETINPITRPIVKYECRVKNIWVYSGTLA